MTIDLVEIVGRFLDGADNREELLAAHQVLTKGYRLVGDHAELPLTREQWVKVDITDLPLLLKSKWFCVGEGTLEQPYIARAKIAGKAQSMQRLLLGLEPGDKRVADHVNYNNLDNRRSNLRAVSKTESVQHRRGWHRRLTAPAQRTRYKGVHKHGKNTWVAVIKHNKERILLGSFSSAIDAAKAYDAAVEKYHGEFGQKNNV